MTRPLSVAEVAEELQVSTGRVRYLIRMGHLPAWQVAGIWACDPKDVRAVAKRLKADPRSKLNANHS